jgi:glucose repression mediator protein
MQDDPDGAMAAYGDALKNNPSCIPAIIAIADILKDRDQYGPAIDYYQQSTRLDENNGEVWANLGILKLVPLKENNLSNI